MTTNLIEEVRAEIYRYFDVNTLIPDTEEVYYSPDKRYFFKSNYYDHSGKNWSWIVSKIEVFQTEGEIKIFEFIRNDDSPLNTTISSSFRKRDFKTNYEKL